MCAPSETQPPLSQAVRGINRGTCVCVHPSCAGYNVCSPTPSLLNAGRLRQAHVGLSSALPQAEAGAGLGKITQYCEFHHTQKAASVLPPRPTLPTIAPIPNTPHPHLPYPPHPPHPPHLVHVNGQQLLIQAVRRRRPRRTRRRRVRQQRAHAAAAVGSAADGRHELGL